MSRTKKRRGTQSQRPPLLGASGKKARLAVVGVTNSLFVNEMKKLDWVDVVEMDDMPKPEASFVSFDECKSKGADHAYYRKFEKRKRT